MNRREFEKQLFAEQKKLKLNYTDYALEALTFEKLICLSYKFRYPHNRDGKVLVTKPDAGGIGGDECIYIRSEEEFLKWKTEVINNYPGATLVINQYGQGRPGKGPWRTETDRKISSKAKVLQRWGSSR